MSSAASSTPASFGTTISSGIQDLSAILSLLGTEQCEEHVGSALRGGDRGGFLYAAVTPLSIFGSLGVAKAAFTVMLLGLPVRGARILQQMGFEAKGDVLALLMPEAEAKRYGAESRLLMLLQRHYLGPSAHKVRVEQPPTTIRLPIRPWNLKLLGTSALVACLGITPYLRFAVLHHTSFRALGIFFPISRVVGGLFCVFPGQLLLQYRMHMIVSQRILFTGINNLLELEEDEVSLPRIPWGDTYPSEICLSSLHEFLQTTAADSEDAKPFLKIVARALRPNLVAGDPPSAANAGLPNANAEPPNAMADLPNATAAQPNARAIATQLEPYLRNTWAWVVMQILLLAGFAMTLVGYVGCFTIVQNSPKPTDTYIWLGTEAFLALIRLLVWAANPPWDDSDGVRLVMNCANREPLLTEAIAESNENPPKTFAIIPFRQFWEGLTGYSGVVSIDKIAGIRRFRLSYYSWTKLGKDEVLSIILEEERAGGRIVLCTKNGENLEFYRAQLSSGEAQRGKQLENDDALMKSPSDFTMDVFEHYRLILELKRREPGDSAIQASWVLSHSSAVTRAIQPPESGHTVQWLTYLNAVRSVKVPDRQDPELATSTVRGVLPAAWNQIEKIIEATMDGEALTYGDFDRCVSFVSTNSGSVDLLQSEVSKYLSEHTKKICKILREPQESEKSLMLKDRYEEKLQIYSKATSVLRRLFKPMGTEFVEDAREKKGGINWQPVKKVAAEKWHTNVVTPLSDLLGSHGQEAAKKALASDLELNLYGSIGGDGSVGEGPTSNFDFNRFDLPQAQKFGLGVAASIPHMMMAEFCEKYEVSEGVLSLLMADGYRTVEGVFEATDRDLRESGLKAGQLAELKRALKDFVNASKGQQSDTESGHGLKST